MDLNLYLGPPLSSPRRTRSAALGSDLALGSPFPPGEPLVPTSVGMPAEPPHAPYSPSRASIIAAPDPPRGPAHRSPPLFARGGGGDGPVIVQEYSPRSPSYQTFGFPYVPLSPPPWPPLPRSRLAEPRHTPPYVPASAADRNSEEGSVGDGGGTPHLVPYDLRLSPGLGDEPLVGAGGGGGGSGGGSPHMRYSPSYLPLSAIPEDDEHVNFAPFRPIDAGSADVFEGGDGPHPDSLDPQFRFRRLINLQSQSRERRRSRLLRPYGDELPDYEMMSSDGSAGNPGKNTGGDEGIRNEGLEEEKEEKNLSSVNFECNICLDLSQEPVVTSCGHLFCWPCLYQWLHLHCTHSECPVCKGEVIESSITPIYGRGNSGTSSQEGRDGGSGLKIPPRPHGHRIESWRQRIRRPISRRFSVGIASTWRRVLGEETGNRIDGDVETSLREMINNSHRRVAPRLRARRSTVVEDSLENGSLIVDHTLPPRNALSSQQSEGNTSTLIQDGLNNWPQFSFVGFDGSSGLAAVSANLSRIFGRSADAGSQSGPSASSGNPRIPDDLIRRPLTGSSQAMEQASASSTMAVIQGDGGIVDMAAEPNSAGTSRPLRRRVRCSSSSDVDGCALHARKRRRLN